MLYLFASYALDTARRELRRGNVLIPLAPQAFDLLEYLLRNRDRVLTKDDLMGSIWDGRTVSESAVSTRINAVRTAIGDSGTQQQLVKTIPRKGIRFVAAVREEHLANPADWSRERDGKTDQRTKLQDIRFCLSRDGTRIAYATCGAGPPVVWAARFMSHLQMEWHSPVWRPWIDLFSRHNTLIRYDGRGCGLSDREHIRFTFDKVVRDLEAVIAAAQVETFAMLGISSGGAIAMKYAALHPDRVKRLILFGAYTRGWLARSISRQEREDANTQIKAIEIGWGQENPAFRLLYASRWIPEATPEEIRSFSDLIYQSMSPQNAAKLMKMGFRLDVRDIAALIRSPTHVMHTRDDSVAPFEEGRKLARLIPGARFVPFASKNHLLLEAEPGFSHLRQEVASVLGVDADP